MFQENSFRKRGKNMPLVPAKCTNCGAPLSVDDSKEAAICPYCETAYIVEKAIQNYSIVNNIKAENIYVQGGYEKEFQIEGGVLTKYNGASIDVVLPEGILKIGKNVFSGTMIRSLAMSDDIMEIDENAFANCKNLCDIVWAKKIKHIGKNAFCNCEKIKKLQLFAVESVDRSAFSGCIGLETLEVSEKFMKRSLSLGKEYTSNNDYWEVVDNLEISVREFESDYPKLYSIYVEGEKLSENDKRLSYFAYTPVAARYLIAKEEQEEREYKEQLRRGMWQEEGVCQHCGGEFKGFFAKKCSKCGKDKDY